MNWRIFGSVLSVAVAFGLANGCGGSNKQQVGLGLGVEGAEAVPDSNLLFPGDNQLPLDAGLPTSSGGSDAGLPDFPGADYSGGFSLVHTASATHETVNGDSFLLGLESGDNNGPGSLPGSYVIAPGDNDDLAYAVYGISGLNDDRPVGIGFEVQIAPIIPGGDDPLALNYWIGIANYTIYNWEWSGPYSEPQSIVLNSPTVRDRYVTSGGSGNMYFAVVAMADQDFVTGNNPLGLVAVQVNTSTVSSLAATDGDYLTTKPHFAMLESAGFGTGGGKMPTELDPDTQYITLEWTHLYDPTAPDLEALHYKVYRRGPGDANEIPIGSVLAPQSVYVDPADKVPGIPEGDEGVTYTYYLRAHNEQGFTTFSTQRATIPIGWQMALTADVYAGDAPVTVNFDASATVPRPGFTIVRYDWNFDWRDPWDDNDFPLQWQDMDATAEHVYDWPPPPDGDFDAVVKVWDDAGDWNIAEVFITLTTQPVAVLDANPLNGNFPLEITFDAGASYDPDDGTDPGAGITDYEWDFDGDGVFNKAGAEKDNRGISHPTGITYNSPGNYNATVRVTDNDSKTDTASIEITVS